MTISPDFRDAVAANDTRLVRIMMKDSMTLDPSFAEFDALSDYASASMTDLYDQHDGEIFPEDKAEWDKDLMNEQMVNVIYNFSSERISFLRSICKVVYAEKLERMGIQEKTAASIAPERKGVQRKHVGAGVAVAGGIVAVAGIVTSETAIIVAGAAAVVVGGALILSDNKK